MSGAHHQKLSHVVLPLLVQALLARGKCFLLIVRIVVAIVVLVVMFVAIVVPVVMFVLPVQSVHWLQCYGHSSSEGTKGFVGVRDFRIRI